MKKLTQKQQQMINNYEYSIMRYGYRGLCDCYKNCSWAKQHAENIILKEMCNNNGYEYTIIGFNSCTFSCAYKYRKNGIEYLVYHTHANKYEIEIGG